MKVGDIVKALMTALQQASKSVQSAAQAEPDPTAKAALAGVATTINPTSSPLLSPYSTTTNTAAIPPTTITISQSGNSTSTTLPGSGSGSIPLPSSSFTTPQPSTTASVTPPASSTAAPASPPSRHAKKPYLPTVLTIGIIIVLGILSIFLALSDTFAFLAFVGLVTFIGFILYSYGFVQIIDTDTELDVTYDLNPFQPPLPATTTIPVAPVPKTEVFYVADNTFTYSQAPAVCKAYGATLATYGQVEEAYHQGAEWCGYGWSEGGIALFPTQQATWDTLQKQPDQQARIKCGRPGVNGGYFDPNTQFGVNCYGVRPAKKASDAPPPTVADNGMDRLVAQFQQNLAKYVVSPFNQKVWSEASGNPQDIQLSQTQTPSANLVPGASQPTTSSVTTPTSSTPMATILSASQTIQTPPIAPPANVNAVLAELQQLGSAPMGILTDTYNQWDSTLSSWTN